MKSSASSVLVYLGLVISLVAFTQATFSEENYKSKYEYKYSFKGPSLSQEGIGIPFWNHSFDAFPGEDQVRVVPSLRTKVGAVWSKFPFPFDEWKVEVSFRVHGRGRLGADGFVLWYAETPNTYGPVFGSMDNWNGLGVFFDSYDNDGKRNNPYISVFVNNGTLSYSHETDGMNQIQGGCLRDFRNRPFPVKAKIIYAEKQLEVYIAPGNSATEEYEFCTIVNDVDLPKDYYFGISAATGALADDHDILKFMTSSLSKRVPGEEPEVVDDDAKKKKEEQKKLDEEYEKNLQEFYSEQQKFREEHPDKVKPDFGKPEDLFQGDSSVELRAVFDVQSKIKEQVNDLTKSIVKIMEKQDNIVSKIEQNQPSDIEVAKSHQIESVAQLQRTTHDSISELKNHINYLKSTSETLIDTVSKLGSNVGAVKTDGGNPYETKQQLSDVVKKLDSIYVGVSTIENKQRNQPRLACPEPDMPSCVSSVVLIAVAAAQVIILLAYHSFQQSREDAAKKFF